jgi:hypothetical protein
MVAVTGFPDECPYELQTVLISKLDQWLPSEKVRNVFYSNIKNWKILMEIYRQVRKSGIF